MTLTKRYATGLYNDWCNVSRECRELMISAAYTMQEEEDRLVCVEFLRMVAEHNARRGK